MSNSMRPHGLYSSWNSLGQNTEVGSLSLLQGIFPAQGSNPDLPHCRWILCQLSYQGSPRLLEWVAYPFLQQIFLTQESNQCLLHCRQTLYQLSYQGSPNVGYKWLHTRGQGARVLSEGNQGTERQITPPPSYTSSCNQGVYRSRINTKQNSIISMFKDLEDKLAIKNEQIGNLRK